MNIYLFYYLIKKKDCLLNVHENLCKDQVVTCLNFKAMPKQLSLSASSKASLDLITLQHKLHQHQHQSSQLNLQLPLQQTTIDETSCTATATATATAEAPNSASSSTFFLNKINNSYTNRPRSMDITKYFQV